VRLSFVPSVLNWVALMTERERLSEGC